MDPDKIPAELKKLRQWCSFRIGPEKNAYGRFRKFPFVPGTNDPASSTDPTTWRSFEKALKYGHPAFCLTPDDPYAFIDIDHADEKLSDQIIITFGNTYCEFSTSGEGFHIFGRGKLSGSGCRRDGIELYDRDRWCLFTGETLEGRGEIGIYNEEDLARLEAEMGAGRIRRVDLEEHPQTMSDTAVMERCKKRSDKFQTLWEGGWQSLNCYPSQSEADHALIGLICSVSFSNEQVRRLFKQSLLYRSGKGKGYIDYTIVKVRAKQQEEAQTDDWISEMSAKSRMRLAEARKPKDENPDELFNDIPEGLLRDLYYTFMDCPETYLPLREGALITAMIVALALFQRKYQTAKRGALNMFMFLLGPAGCGKDIIAKGPEGIFDAAGIKQPHVFGGELRSLAAVEQALRDCPRHMSYVAETASWMRGLCDEHSGQNWRELRTKITEVFSRGTSHLKTRQVKRERGSSAPPDPGIWRPCLTIYGETIPGDFYAALGQRQGGTGFIPRLSVMEVDRHKIAVKSCRQKEWDESLLKKIREHAEAAMQHDVVNMIGVGADPIRVPINSDAEDFLEEIEVSHRQKMIASNGDFGLLHEIAQRTAEKMLRVATLLAVCFNPAAPRVFMEHVVWAQLFLKTTDGRMLERITSGVHDDSGWQQRKRVVDWLYECQRTAPSKKKSDRNFGSEQICEEPQVVPYAWLSAKANNSSPFQKDRRGIRAALKGVLYDLLESGIIMEVPKDDCLNKFNVRGATLYWITSEPQSSGGLFETKETKNFGEKTLFDLTVTSNDIQC